MRNQKLYESVRKYIDKYYIDKPDDIKLDKEMKSIFDRISEFRKKKTTKKCDAVEEANIEIDESAVESFDVESMQKTKATDSMSLTLATNRNIESLMGQMDETFSQRLLRLIDERGPIWNGGRNREEELLANCYFNSMKLAMDNGIRSIAFPSISTGAYGFPVELATKIAVHTVKRFLQDNPDSFDLVEWVLFDTHTKSVYEAEVR